MPAPKNFPWTFRNVSARHNGAAVFVASHDQSAKTDAPVSSLLLWSDNSWKSQDSCAGDGTVFATLESPKTPMMLIKEGVIYHWLEKGGFKEEVIDPSPNGPQHFGDMEDLRIIDGKAYVAGMARCVYCRNTDGTWTAIDKDIRSKRDENVGFFSVDGFSQSEIYAVGLEGQIGIYDGKRWTMTDSPMDQILYRVLCAPDGKVYACGQKGVLIEGRNNQWKKIKHNVTGQTFWGSAWFKDHLYLSTSEGIYKLVENDLLKLDIFSSNGDALETQKGLSFYRLDARDSVLWSVGSKMAMWTEDGEHWHEVGYEKRV